MAGCCAPYQQRARMQRYIVAPRAVRAPTIREWKSCGWAHRRPPAFARCQGSGQAWTGFTPPDL